MGQRYTQGPLDSGGQEVSGSEQDSFRKTMRGLLLGHRQDERLFVPGGMGTFVHPRTRPGLSRLQLVGMLPTSLWP